MINRLKLIAILTITLPMQQIQTSESSISSRNLAIIAGISALTAGTLYSINYFVKPAKQTARSIETQTEPIIEQLENDRRDLLENIDRQNLEVAQIQSALNQAQINLNMLQNQNQSQLSQQDQAYQERIRQLTRQINDLQQNERTLTRDIDAKNNQLARVTNDLSNEKAHVENTLHATSMRLQEIYDNENNFFTQLNNPNTNPFQNDFPALYNPEISEYNRELDKLTNTFDRDIAEEEYQLGTTNSLIKNKTIANRMISPKKPATTSLYKQIILKVVHGTFTKGKSAGGDLNKPFSQALDVFAKQLALAHNATVKFDVFEWDSKLALDKRQQAGDVLAEEIIKDKQETPDAIIWMIGHSHGCNVINFAAQKLKTSNIIIDNAIFLASPVLDINPLTTPEKSYNIKSLLNIWGNKDVTGALGSLLTTITSNPTFDLRKNQALGHDEIVRNIILKCDGRDLNHGSIKVNSLHFLAGIIQYIGNNFLIPANIIINVYDQNQSAQSSHQKAEGGIESNRTTPSHSANSKNSSPTPQTSPQNASSAANFEEEDDDYIPTDIFAHWAIQGVIDNKEPLQAQQLQKMLAPNIRKSLDQSIALSNENEITFENMYHISIHQKPTLTARFMDEYGNPIMNWLGLNNWVKK